MAKRSKGKRQRELQRALAGSVVAPAAVITFAGKPFRVAEKVGLMPLLKFAHLAKLGVDGDDMEGLVAIYDLLVNVIDPVDWDAFEQHSIEVRASGDDLMEVVTQAIQAITARPTVRPSDSSDGPARTKDSSPDDSSSRVIRRLEKEGRPSIALMVRQAQEHGSRVSA